MDLMAKLMAWLPVIVSFNVALSAIGAVADKIQSALGKPGASPVGAFIAKISGWLKKILDLATGNVAH
jgi:hypothetical protein